MKHAGHALRFASPELRADRELVRAAIQRSGSALQYASHALRADLEILVEARKGHPDPSGHPAEDPPLVFFTQLPPYYSIQEESIEMARIGGGGTSGHG